jgi:hypothetical protein
VIWQADVQLTAIEMNDFMLIDTVVYIMHTTCLKILSLVYVGPVGDKGEFRYFFPKYHVDSAFSVSTDQLLHHNQLLLPLIIVSKEICPHKTKSISLVFMLFARYFGLVSGRT